MSWRIYKASILGSTTFTLSHPAAVADDRIRRPEQRVRVAVDGAAGTVGRARSVEQRHHGLPQRFAARERRIVALAAEQVGYQFARRSRMHRPIGDQKRARAGIEERAA